MILIFTAIAALVPIIVLALDYRNLRLASRAALATQLLLFASSLFPGWESVSESSVCHRPPPPPWPPNNSLKPTRRACGEVGGNCPPVWAIERSSWLLRRVGVGLVLVAGGGYSVGSAASFRRAA
jgi:hypothetical protein